jgi:diaminopimelate decarboxylase
MIGAAMAAVPRPTPTPTSLCAPPLAHLLPIDAQIGPGGGLQIGGCDLVSLAREHGTPAYVVSEADLRERARTYMRELAALHGDFDVLFASKAFPCTAVYRVLAQEGLGCDVASGGELALALAGGFDPERIYMHGNAKSASELREALAAGVGHIVIDSLEEIERLEMLAASCGRRQRVLLRITPGVAGDTHAAISTGQSDSKFGIAPEQAPAAIARLEASRDLELVGLHFHIGSQLLELEPFREAIRQIARLGRFGVYNLGGGLGVAYTREQRPPTIAAYLRSLVQAAHELLGSDVRLLVEPGRSLVARSTVTLYEVQSIKRNVSTWVGVDGGMSDNLRPMLYGARYEALLADRPAAEPSERCRLVGKHCESGDVIIADALLPPVCVGDILLTPATGAYGYALANNYNGVPRPPVIFCAAGRARVVVRRESYRDLMARDVDEEQER